MQPINESRKRRLEATLGALGRGLAGPALFALALALAVPAFAGDPGSEAGSIETLGTLKLELDANLSQFQFVPVDGALDTETQVVFDQKIIKRSNGCKLGLTPPEESPPAPPGGGAELVSFANSATVPGLDAGKFAIGGRDGKGTGCGQWDFGEGGRIDMLGGQVPLIVGGRVQLQVEAKQNASVQLDFFLKLDDEAGTEILAGTRYLLTGSGTLNPPLDVSNACGGTTSGCELVAELLPKSDGGPDAGTGDDGLWEMDSVPPHNVEVFRILQNSDGSAGAISLKGGGEYTGQPGDLDDPASNRSEWNIIAADGILDCFDGFDTNGLVGRRLANVGGVCGDLIPYTASFDGSEAEFVADNGAQAATYKFDLNWLIEQASGLNIAPSKITFRDDFAIDCESSDPPTCFDLELCTGTSVRACSGGELDTCLEDADCVDQVCSDDVTLVCTEDSDCTAGTCGPQTCEFVELIPSETRCSDDNTVCAVDGDCGAGASCAPGFEDLDSGLGGTQYGCVAERVIQHLGTVSRCSGTEDSCEIDGDCTAGTCEPIEDAIDVDECIFVEGDLKMSRKTR